MAYLDKKKININKVKCSLPLSTINTLINYSLTLDDSVTISNLCNLNRLISNINIEASFNPSREFPSIERLRLLKEILNLNINYDVEDYDELMEVIKNRTSEDYITRSTIENIFERFIESPPLTHKQILYVNNFIQTQLDLSAIQTDIEKLKNAIAVFEHPTPEEVEANLPVMKDLLITLNKKFNLNSMDDEGKNNSFNIADRSNAKNIIKKSLETIFNPGNKLTTGYKMLDAMLGGGLQEERCYLLLGVAKSFKSGTLLNIVMNVATMYYDYQLKDQTKTPAVLYFTMENSMIETFERIYRYLGLEFNFKYENIKNKKGKTIKKYLIDEKDVQEILDIIERETIEKTGIALRIEFRTHMSVDTGELDKFYENYLLNDNQELILVVQDYIKRIKSQRNYKTEQKRDELGEVINEFCNFAKTRKIPVLTASQLNRQALKSVEDGKSSRKKDLSRRLGGSQIGESSLLYENADYTIITYREEDEENGTIYQTFNKVMARGDSYIDYFAQPYDPDPKYKNFRIATDYDLDETLGVERISDSLDQDDIKVIANSNNSVKLLKNRKNSNDDCTYDVDDDGEDIGEYDQASLF